MTKQELTEKLRHKGALWSYAPGTDISDEILLQTALQWGEVEEIQSLFRIFPKKQIRKVWQEKLIPDMRMEKHNYYLARIFFNIKNPKRYIAFWAKKNSRYERIKQFTSSNPKSS